MGFDVGFYLNQNKVIKQFKNANIGKAIESLCLEYNISVSLPPFKNIVNKIYKDVTFADVIKELLKLEKDKEGKKDLYIDCKNGKLNINQYAMEQDLTALIGNNLMVASDRTYSNCSVKKSIKDLKNRVIYTDNNETSVKQIIRQNPASISSFGLLTTIEEVDTNKNNNLEELAQNKLDELNKVKEEISLNLLGDYRVSKGKLIDFTNTSYGLDGVYLVKSASHEISGAKETVSVSIEKLNA